MRVVLIFSIRVKICAFPFHLFNIVLCVFSKFSHPQTNKTKTQLQIGLFDFKNALVLSRLFFPVTYSTENSLATLLANEGWEFKQCIYSTSVGTSQRNLACFGKSSGISTGMQNGNAAGTSVTKYPVEEFFV